MTNEKLLDNGYCYKGGKIHLTELTDEKIRLIPDLFEIERKFRCIAVSNLGFRYLITFAVDPAKLGFGNSELSIEKFISWFKKQEKKKGLEFLIFPIVNIASIDGRFRLHFHGLINDRIELSDTNTRIVNGFAKPVTLNCIEKNGIPESEIKSPVYTAPAWKYGYSVVYPITDCYFKAVSYLVKELISFENFCINKPYFHSKKLLTDFNSECFIKLLDCSSEFSDNKTVDEWLKIIRYL